MKFIILASGSKGNSTLLISNRGDLLLIDVGISYKEIKEKMGKYGYDIKDVKSILITHEHVDHIKSIASFPEVKKYALEGISVVDGCLKKYEEQEVEGFYVRALPLSHDVKCGGFVIRDGNEQLVYITDTGYFNHKNEQYIKNADYYIFESNHNVEMLMETKRPFYIKSRILGDEGHLNNETASDLLCDVIGDKTKQIYLAHLSLEANTKELALNTFYRVVKEREIDISKIVVRTADQYMEIAGGEYYEETLVSG